MMTNQSSLQKRCVSFREVVGESSSSSIHETLILAPVSATTHPEDCLDTFWFTPRELKQIQQDCQDVIANSNKNDAAIGESGDYYSDLRGLELVIGNISFLRLQQEWNRSVLREQERIREETGTVEPEDLAQSIMATCQHKQRIAHLRGVQDAQAVYGITTEPAKVLLIQHQLLREKHRSKRTERRKQTARRAVAVARAA
jgi:hypothetical protein